MSKVRCYKGFKCQVCNCLGLIQIFYNRRGEVTYARVRHYTSLDPNSKKPQFEYHRQEDLKTVENFIKSQAISKPNSLVDQNPTDQAQPTEICDHKLKESSSVSKNTGAGSLARLGHLLDVQKVAGSSPARPTI
jgi:hypothetical protein